MDPDQIRRFYLNGFQESTVHREWSRLWSKHFRARLPERRFIKLNNYKPKLNFRSLKKLCVDIAPQHVYMSVLNWLMPDRVGPRCKAEKAYPIGGEYVADIDIIRLWRPWGGVDNLSPIGYQIAYDKTLTLVGKMRENYRDIHIVFSGKRGFHVHVRDFDVRDWTHYDVRRPVRSHEVARFLYTRHLQNSLGDIGRHHFILSTDPLRLMTVPETLNGETGKICYSVGGLSDFEGLTFGGLLNRSDSRRFLYDSGFESLHSHLEPLLRMRQ